MNVTSGGPCEPYPEAPHPLSEIPPFPHRWTFRFLLAAAAVLILCPLVYWNVGTPAASLAYFIGTGVFITASIIFMNAAETHYQRRYGLEED